MAVRKTNTRLCSLLSLGLSIVSRASGEAGICPERGEQADSGEQEELLEGIIADTACDWALFTRPSAECASPWWKGLSAGTPQDP